MPFTPSHAVVALPFARSALPAAAVAVGAMTPDLPLFVRGTALKYSMTHSFAWLPVTVGLALVFLLLWRCILRPAARELAPTWLAERLPAGWDGGSRAGLHETFAVRGRARASWTGALLVVLALVIGVASHIAWDWFTHEGRVGTSVFPVLDASWGPLPGYKWLQYGSTVAGLVILAVWAALRLRRAEVTSVHRALPAAVRVTWWILLPAILVGSWCVGWAILGPFTADFTPQYLGYNLLLPACAGWGAITLLLCVVVQAVRDRRRTAENRAA